MSKPIDHEEEFNLSYWRATQATVDGKGFVDDFLDNLIASSPEVAGHFQESSRQVMGRALLLAIVHLAACYSSGEPDPILQGIADRHNRSGRNIEPHLYDFFVTALLATVERFDPDHTPVVAESWKLVLTPGLDYIRSKY